MSNESIAKLLAPIAEAERPDAERRLRWALAMGWYPLGYELPCDGERQSADDLMFLCPNSEYAYLPRDVDPNE